MSNIQDGESVQVAVNEVSRIVSEMSGIQLGAKQAPMVENRLRARMLRLGIEDFEQYLSFLKAQKESESQALLSLITTHHTYFFREFAHFEYLVTAGLKKLIETARKRSDKKIKIWSAACSRGQEVYSLAMFFHFHLKQMAPDVAFEIHGSDVDPESVQHGKNGVYLNEELKQSPQIYMDSNWVKGKDNVAAYSKVKDHLKEKCKFSTINLLDCDSFLSNKSFDVIFCRNVFIYFKQSQIKQITETFLKHLDQEGMLFLGVSETLSGLGLSVDSLGPSIYQHKHAKKLTESTPIVAAVATKKVMDVLAIDDSPTILALLKKILTPETGFKVVATAKNGREAIDILKAKTVDFITLDLHMPELDGIGFLREYKNREAPILIVSAISRDNADVARQAISLGACDYVEKPSLDNAAQAGNEIRSKMKTALQVRKPAASAASVTTKASSTPTRTPLQARPVPVTTKATPVQTKVQLAPAAQPAGPIKVLVVDDSKTIRDLLKKILSQDPMLKVVAEAERPSQVEDLIRKHQPDVITLDIHMPEMDGVTLLSRIHPLFRIPTVMISSISKEEGPQVLRALEIGAVDYIQKPQMNEITKDAEMIRERLKIAARAKIMQKGVAKKRMTSKSGFHEETLIVMGASTGGTEALRVVLEAMPAEIPPILIVQHIPPVFSAAFASRLDGLCAFEVREAVDGDRLKPGLVLIAPGGKQMAFRQKSDLLTVQVTDDGPVNRHKPSVDYMFKTVAGYNRKNVIGVILTGMGADGADQLKVLRDQGARTIAQDEHTSVVYGMPREAALRGGAEFVLPIDQIAEKIMSLCETQAPSLRKKPA